MEGMSQEGSISFQLIYLIDALYYCPQFCAKCDQGEFSCMHIVVHIKCMFKMKGEKK